MVKLVIGKKGSGKTKKMVDLVNERVDRSQGNLIFINKNNRLMYDLKHKIRVISMQDYEDITNSDEYIGFIFGIISSDHDIEAIFIDSILKLADIGLDDIPEFLNRLDNMGKQYGLEFIVSLSASEVELGDRINKYEVLAVSDQV